MTSRLRLLAPLAVGLAFAAHAHAAWCDDGVDEARAAFARGAELAKDAQWGAALASFERSAKLHPHAWTTYNIAVCERALGQYVRARRMFARALDERRPDADLPEATVADIQRFEAEIDQLVADLDVTLDPADASMAIDGSPLEAAPGGALFAGTLPAGPGKPPPAAHFHVVLDPGTHVLTIARQGYSTALQTETLRPGEHKSVRLVAARIPATLRIDATTPGAVVAIDGLDVGTTPLALERPGGVHHVVVRKPGFDPYAIDVRLAAGEQQDLRAKLKVHEPSLLTRWWFWGATVAVVGGAAVATYALTRPAPERPPVDGGGLGWAVRVP